MRLISIKKRAHSTYLALRAGHVLQHAGAAQVRTASGRVEKVKIEDLAVGEVRNVTSEAGTSVVVGRHEKGYVLDIAGERIEVNTPDVQALSTEEELVMVGASYRALLFEKPTRPLSIFNALQVGFAGSATAA